MTTIRYRTTVDNAIHEEELPNARAELRKLELRAAGCDIQSVTIHGPDRSPATNR